MKYFCKSELVSLYIQKYVQYRKRKVFYPVSGKMSDLVPIMVKHKTETYFVPQSSAHDDELKNMFDAAGLKHDEAVMYYTVSNDFGPDEAFDYDMLVFFSPEGIHSLLKNFPNFEQGNIVIEGRAKIEEDRDGKVFCNRISKFQTKRRKLWIQFDTIEMYEQNMQKLNTILNGSKGQDSVYIYIKPSDGKERMIKQLEDVYVNASDILIDRLNFAFGENNVKVTD